MKLFLMLSMGHISHHHLKHCIKYFAKEGISRSQPWVLNFLHEHDGAIQRELSDHSFFDPASITNTLSSMEEQGLVVRKGVASDKRRLQVYLTDKGKEKYEYVEQIHTKMDAQAFKGFSQEEREKMFEFLERIKKNLEEVDVDEVTH